MDEKDLSKFFENKKNKIMNLVGFGSFKSINDIKKTVSKSIYSSVADIAKNGNKYLKASLPKSNSISVLNNVNANIILSSLAYTSNVDDIYKSTKYELNGFYRGMYNQSTRDINETINKLAKENKATIVNVQKALYERFERYGIFKVRYNNGRNFDADKYTKMVARTAKIECDNVSTIQRAIALGTDLVKLEGNSETCGVCARYRDRWFSISGKTPGYASLYETVFSKGYHTIHPNCRCKLIAVYESHYTEEELNERKKESVKPFKDDRAIHQKKGYDKWQEKNKQLWDEEREYKEMNSVLGADMKYINIGSFRRAKRQESIEYIKLKAELKYQKDLQKADGNDIINVSGAQDNKDRQYHGELRYPAIRKDKYDVEKIAKNTGLKKDDVQKIKEHLFLKKQDIFGERKLFDPNDEIAKSWDRLRAGADIREEDLILIKHELMEMELIEQGLSRDEAHCLSNKKYNFTEASNNAKYKKSKKD